MGSARMVMTVLAVAVLWMATDFVESRVTSRLGVPQPGIEPGPVDRPSPSAAGPRRTAESSGPIDPGPHRAAIETIESELFRIPDAHDDGFRDRGVSGALHDLATALLRVPGIGRQAGVDVLSFSSRIGSQQDAGYRQLDLAGLRRDWEQIRARWFQPADWMARSTPGLARRQRPPPPTMDPATREAIEDVLADLDRRIARAKRDVEGLGEPRYDPDAPGRSDGGQIRQWYQWGERWRRDLGRTLRPVQALDPAPSFSNPADLDYAMAIHHIERAIRALNQVPNGAGMWPTPFRGAWEANFRAGEAELSEARLALGKAGRG